MEQTHPDLVMVDLVMPDAIGETAQASSGLQLLKTLMERYPKLNLVVQSAHVRTLVWLKPTIDNHMGGFTVVDKSQPVKDLLTMVDWALRERTYTPKETRNGLQLKPAWMQVLQLAFQESLQDTAIARHAFTLFNRHPKNRVENHRIAGGNRTQKPFSSLLLGRFHLSRQPLVRGELHSLIQVFSIAT